MSNSALKDSPRITNTKTKVLRVGCHTGSTHKLSRDIGYNHYRGPEQQSDSLLNVDVYLHTLHVYPMAFKLPLSHRVTEHSRLNHLTRWRQHISYYHWFIANSHTVLFIKRGVCL
eukprot:scpid32241/ scgid9248/ 